MPQDRISPEQVTIGIEGWNSADLDRRDVFIAAVRSLKRQTFSLERCEILVVVDSAYPEGIENLRELLPKARFLELPGATYYRSKNRIMREAEGDFIVFADSDVTYLPGWMDALLAAFRPGVDLVCGESRYPPSFLARSLTFCDWPATRSQAGFTDWFAAHNLAIRRERIPDMQFREDLGRSGGGAPNVLREQLLARNLRPWFQPEALAFHHPAPFVPKRLRLGAYNVHWRLRAPETAWSWTARVPLLAPFLTTGGTLINACRRAWRGRDSYPGGALAFPLFVLTISYCKAVELAGACLYCWAPSWLHRRYRWFEVPAAREAGEPVASMK